MSEIDTLIGGLIGVGGAVVAAVVVHILDERRERNRLRRETALRPLEFSQPALRDACNALMDYMTSYGRHRDDTKKLAAFLIDDQLDIPFGRAFLWCSEATRTRIVEFVNKSVALAAAAPLLSGTASPNKEESVFISAFSSAYKSMAKDLGVEILPKVN